QGVELLDGCVGAVRDHGARVQQGAVGVGELVAVGPEALGEIAVGGRVRELHRAGHADCREAAEILLCQALGVLDPLAEAERLPVAANASSASRLARSPMACTATGQPARAPARITSASSSPVVIETPEPSSSHAVCEPRVPSMNAFR